MSIELNRSAFEAFAQRNEFGTYRTDRKGDGYDSSHTQLMWMAWCAAIQQAESEPAGEPRARVELMKTGGNAGLSTRIIELDTATRERLRPGDLLYTHPSPGVPVGQAPSVWNSIQIASWIGSQLMHEPSMFERAAVCKFVRSLGRHPTLLKHSPKIHQAPSVPDGYALVPIEPTDEMMSEMLDPFIALKGDNRSAFIEAYPRMLTAAKKETP